MSRQVLGSRRGRGRGNKPSMWSWLAIMVRSIWVWVWLAVMAVWAVSLLKMGPTTLTIHSAQSNSNDDAVSLRLSHAVNTLRCLTIPKCYPTLSCVDDEAPMQIKTTIERQAFCMSDLRTKSSDKENNGKCLVYSFGINDNTEWEEKMKKEFGCDVFAFDPTSNLPEKITPGVTFHQIGLQGDGVDVSKTHSVLYDALDPSKLLTLGQIIKLMGHTGRNIDILRLDCEGCEWGVLKQLACSGESQLVEQLMVEMHFQKTLGLATDEDILIAADAIACLEKENWGIVSMEQNGCDLRDADYIEPAMKVIRGPIFLMLVTMKRLTNKEEQHFWADYPNICTHTKVAANPNLACHNYVPEYETYQAKEEEKSA